MKDSHLHLSGLTLIQHRIPIRVVSIQHLKRRFCQMSGDGTHRFGVPLVRPQPSVQLADVP
jgi:hypothetical protein